MSEAMKQESDPETNTSAAFDIINSVPESGEQNDNINKNSTGNFSSERSDDSGTKRKSRLGIGILIAGICIVSASVVGAKIGADIFQASFSQLESSIQEQGFTINTLSLDVETMKEKSLVSDKNSENIRLLGIQIAAVDERVNAVQQDRTVILEKTEDLLVRIETIDKEIQRLGLVDDRLNKQISKRPAPVKRKTTVQPTYSRTIKNTNLELLSVDYWANQLQAVVKTPDGRTLFLSQGDKYDGWRVLKIDRASSEVWLDKNNKKQKLVAAL